MDYDEDKFEDSDYQPDSEYSSGSNDNDHYNEMDPKKIAELAEPHKYKQQNENEEANPSNVKTEEEYEDNEDNEDEKEDKEDEDNEDVQSQESVDQPQQPINQPAPVVTMRAGRISHAPQQLLLHQSHLQAASDQEVEYSFKNAKIMHCSCYDSDESWCIRETSQERTSVCPDLQPKGLKKFGNEGHNAAFKEIKQLHDRIVFEPIHLYNLTDQERKRAMESLIFLVEKRNGRVKGRACANGSTQRDYMDREDAASPTAATEAILITALIDAKQIRDVMTANIPNIPNAFVQTNIEPAEKGKKYHYENQRTVGGYVN